MSITVLVAFVIILMTLVGIYGATSTVISQGGDEIEDEGGGIASCFGELAQGGEEDGDCNIFGSNGDD